MGTLSNISSDDTIRAFKRLGWAFDRQRGSHQVYILPGAKKNLVIPVRKEMRQGTLRALIRDAGMTVDQFLALL